MIEAGRVFKVKDENEIIDGCTVSLNDIKGVIYFSLAQNTDISPEMYKDKKILFINYGTASAYNNKFSKQLNEGQAVIINDDIPLGVKTQTGAVYTELTIRRDSKMNGIIKDGNVFALKDLVPYQEGKIVNADIASNDKMKFVVMAFDEGTGLTEHAAPGEALIFALDGEGVIGYEGKEYPIKAGENFKFAKQGRHYVKATKKFKMALFLTLE